MPVEATVLAAVLLLMSGLLHILPNLTRPDLFFAVTVLPDFRRTAEARRILRRFRILLWIGTLLAVALQVTLGLALAAILVEGAAFLLAVVNAHRAASAHAAAANPVVEVDLAAPREGLPGGILTALVPILLLAGLGVWAQFHPDRLPARLPVHSGFHGTDRWVAATPESVWTLVAIHGFLCLMLAGLAWTVLHRSRRISSTGPAGAAERKFRRRVAEMLIVTEYLHACPPWLAILWPDSNAMTLWGISLMAVLLAYSVSLIRGGQGGSRAMAMAGGAPVGDRTPDECWKLGLIYCNPQDPAILVEKRFGIGYTLNFGNRWTWVSLAALLFPVPLAMLLLH